MPDATHYSIHQDVKFAPLELIDAGALEKSVKESWFNQTLCRVNDSVVRLGVFKSGEFHWHKHDNEDEFFFCLSGRFVVETRTEKATLEPRQGFMVPKGVVHRTLAPEPATVLMVEGAGVKPTGD
jgi:mannose-6-phosphate isomerase-like protein (cupin superfamily)